MKKNWGIYLCIILSILMLAAGINQLRTGNGSANLLLSSPILFIGALAYWSAKQRGSGRSGFFRMDFEIIAIGGVLYLAFARNDFVSELTADPIPTLLIPLAVLVAYVARLVLNLKQKKAQ